MPALRMAANLVGRRIAAAVARVQAEPPPTEPDARVTPVVPRPAVKAPTQAPPGMRRFRGREVS
jgi:hypothetical protein